MRFEVKFPFTQSAKKWVNEESLINPKPSLVQRAIDLIIASLKKGRFPIMKEEGKEAILVFYIVRLILSYMNNSYLTNRVSIAYSKSVYEEIISKKDEFDEELRRLCRELSLRIEEESKKYRIPVEDYLTFSPDSPDYYLYYLEVSKGYVFLNFHQLKRVIQEAITKRLINLKHLENVPDEIKKAAKRIQASLPSLQPKRVKVKMDEYPPCISKIMDDLFKHKNLSHYARWALAVFLFNIGWSKESIIRLFSNLPDFSEKITRYQVEHIFRKGYKMLSCDKMALYGLCISKCGLKNPLEYKKAYGKLDKKKV